MQAVIMAAGEGRRLRPISECYAKPVLPIDGRPLIVTVLNELGAAGIRPVTIVVGHLRRQIEQLLDGTPHEIRFVLQPEPLGSADAVRRAGLDPPYLVVGADTLFGAGDIARFLRSAAAHDGAVAVRRRPPPGPGRSAVRVENGLVTLVLDDDPGNPLAGAPLWFVGEPVHRHLADLPGPPFELAGAVQRAVDEGGQIAGVEIGPTRDLTHAVDLVVENFGYLEGL